MKTAGHHKQCTAVAEAGIKSVVSTHYSPSVSWPLGVKGMEGFNTEEAITFALETSQPKEIRT